MRSARSYRSCASARRPPTTEAVDRDAAVDAKNTPTPAWKTRRRVSHTAHRSPRTREKQEERSALARGKLARGRSRLAALRNRRSTTVIARRRVFLRRIASSCCSTTISRLSFAKTKTWPIRALASRCVGRRRFQRGLEECAGRWMPAATDAFDVHSSGRQSRLDQSATSFNDGDTKPKSG